MELPTTMKAMILDEAKNPLALKTIPLPEPSSHQVLIKVIACGVCRTDLHIVDGELTGPKLPLIPGHEIIGEVLYAGSDVVNITTGDMVGVPWLGYTCL